MNDIVDTLTEHLSRFPGVERIILFGSRARGDAAARSDIDLAISGRAITKDEWRQIWCCVDEARTLLSIDLVRLETASDELKEKVRREGKVLYERSQASAVHEEFR